jgi:hypothetical protein
LSAVKLASDPNNPIRMLDSATTEELRAEAMKHLGILTEAGILDLEALPLPNGGTTNQPVRGIDQSGVSRNEVSLTGANRANECQPARSVASNGATPQKPIRLTVSNGGAETTEGTAAADNASQRQEPRRLLSVKAFEKPIDCRG